MADTTNYVWICAICRFRVVTTFNLHINERMICAQCNAEMEPQSGSSSAQGKSEYGSKRMRSESKDVEANNATHLQHNQGMRR